ncbi:MAG: molybdate ABC transporter substrate-binding protein [Dehalococcoidia bacterium]|nr:molybdate ABC transporter substrate-binding protein [Dehalococcoidia bacterium]MYA51871.1 molybdate ABC transporter substrate-binding protein [Dehalococcoidia bacterium]
MIPRATAAAGLAAIALALGACSGDDGHEEITVFAAASLTDAFGELATVFEAEHPDLTVRLSLAGSATLRTQILEGAPADVFASASPDEVEALEAEGLVRDQRTLASNRLVVATRGDAIGSFADLAAPGVRLVLAGEDVPAGRYARAALALADTDGAFGEDFAGRVLANVRSNEANVRAALAKVELGEADAAIVYATDLAAADGVRAIPVPRRFQVAAEYRIALLSGSDAAAAFVAFATSPEGAATLARHGFMVVGATP